MITPKELEIVEKYGQNPEFVHAILSKYCKNNVIHTKDILRYIPILTENMLSVEETKIGQYSYATDLLIAERYNNPNKEKKTRKGASISKTFPNLLYTCLVHFPKGDAYGCGEANEAFLDELIDYIENKRGFDYDNSEDWKWAMRSGTDAYILNIIRTYINPKFEPPEILLKSMI